jgi:hypothetical protein
VNTDDSSACAPRAERSPNTVDLGSATAPSILDVMRGRDALAALNLSTPCHATVTTDKVDLMFGRVLDAVVPLAPDDLRATRDHRQAGGTVRLHGRRLAELDAARADLTRP